MSTRSVVCLMVIVLAVIAGNDLLLVRHLNQPPAPVSPLAVAASEYSKTLPEAYRAAAEATRSGKVSTKADLVQSLAAHARPLATAQDTECSHYVDADGRITNPVGLASMLDTVAMSLEQRGR